MPAATPNPSRWPLPAALAYLLFPVYGSLVPLAWTPRDPGAAWAAFAALMAAPLAIRSQADFAANELLMAPFSFLMMGALAQCLRGATARLLGAALLLPLCGGIAVALEFAQMFFSGRDPAQSDVLAQSLGALLGLLAWVLVPAAFWAADSGAQQRQRRVFLLYLAGLVLYALMPLDLTVSASDLADKWRAGRVRLLPFSGWAAAPAASLTNFALDVGLWAVAAWLWRRAAAPRPAPLLNLVALAALLELAQLLVLSRTTDPTTVLAALLGVLLGARGPAGLRMEGAALSMRWLLAAAASLALVLLQTWPFELVSGGAAFRARLADLTWVPFATYTGGGELDLVTNLLRRLAAYGALAWVWAWALEACSPRTRWGLGLLAVVGTAALVEGLQLLMPADTMDLGDPILAAAIAAGVLGLRAPGAAATSRAPAPPRALPSADRPNRKVALVWLLPLAGAAVLLPALPGVPYNLRELLGGGAALPVLVALLLVLGLPRWLAERAAVAWPGALWRTPLGLLGAALGLALLLRVGAPLESVHDLVGSASASLGPFVEPWLRLAVLLLAPLWGLALGHALGEGGRSSGRSTHLLLHGLWVLPLWHAVVVLAASTDNLTELMAGGGGWAATLALLACPVVLGLAAAQLRRPGGLRRALVAALSLAALALLLQAGTEAMLIKYGRAFSALQFLLSSDRAQYAQGPALLLRLLLVLGVAQLLAWGAGWLADALSRPPGPAAWSGAAARRSAAAESRVAR
jgi:hypothetical protein